MTIYQLGSKKPHIDESAFVCDEACIIGAVTLGKNVSIWPFASLRADNEPIVIGDNSNVQESAVLHTDINAPLTVHENVTVGHQAMLHGCEIGAGSLIGMQAIILNHAVIGKNCLIAAGALVSEGKIIPDNSLVIGSPGRVVRTLSPEEIAAMQEGTKHYLDHIQEYKQGLKRL